MSVYRIPADRLADLRDKLAELAMDGTGDEGEYALVLTDALVPALVTPPRPGGGQGVVASRCPHCDEDLHVIIAVPA